MKNALFDTIATVQGTKRETYGALVVQLKENPSTFKEIAKWNQDRAGYPCTVHLGEARLICHDGDGLRDALTQVLQDPVVGEAIYRYMGSNE